VPEAACVRIETTETGKGENMTQEISTKFIEAIEEEQDLLGLRQDAGRAVYMTCCGLKTKLPDSLFTPLMAVRGLSSVEDYNVAWQGFFLRVHGDGQPAPSYSETFLDQIAADRRDNFVGVRFAFEDLCQACLASLSSEARMEALHDPVLAWVDACKEHQAACLTLWRLQDSIAQFPMRVVLSEVLEDTVAGEALLRAAGVPDELLDAPTDKELMERLLDFFDSPNVAIPPATGANPPRHDGPFPPSKGVGSTAAGKA
jgi:hypothetical protein